MSRAFSLGLGASFGGSALRLAVLRGSRCPQNHRVALRAAGVSFNVDGLLDTGSYQLRRAPTSAEAARRTA